MNKAHLSSLPSHRRSLVCFARSLGANPDDAEDLAQKTLLKALLNIEQFTGGKFRAWLYTILRNEKYSMHRRDSYGPVYIEDVPDVGMDSRQENIYEVEQLFGRIERLSPIHREALHMLIHGSEYTEIAYTLGIPLGTVKSRIGRAREALETEA